VTRIKTTVYPLIFRFLEANRILGLMRMLRTVPLWLVRRDYFVFVRDLRLPLPDIPAHPAVRWSILTEAEMPAVHTIHPLMSEAEIRRRWNEGQECLLFWLGQSLVHLRWDTTKPTYLPYLGKTVQPLNGDLLVTEVFTHPAYRRSGIHSVSSVVGLHRSRERGLTRSVAFVASWNAPSMRVTGEKSAYSVVGRVGYWKIGGLRYYFVSDNVSLGQGESIYIHDGKPPQQSLSRAPLTP
jgi:hypothetical protein